MALEPSVSLDNIGSSLIITINRPQQMNCIDGDAASIIARAVDRAEVDASVRSIIVTGSGPKAFCTGMDLKYAQEHGIDSVVLPGRGLAGLARYEGQKPIIAAVNGYAVGGGFEIALNADIIIASNNALFGLPEAKIGMLATGGSLVKFPEFISRAMAMELALTCVNIDAAKALQLGMINAVVDPDELIPTALDYAAKIAACGPEAIKNAKQLIRYSYSHTREIVWDLNDNLAEITSVSEEGKEGILSFIEKRKPSWAVEQNG